MENGKKEKNRKVMLNKTHLIENDKNKAKVLVKISNNFIFLLENRISAFENLL
jgi:hypothetical protein